MKNNKKNPKDASELKTLKELNENAKLIHDGRIQHYYLELGRAYIKINSSDSDDIKDGRKKLEKFINNSFDKIKFFINNQDHYKEEWRDEAIFLYRLFLSWDNDFNEDNILKILENFIGKDGMETMNQELQMEELIKELKDNYNQMESQQ
ncbi:hypothetical protein CBLAS_1435 [Campylobacter blaseri]|uniref:Uncharacterized protein n=1 Tax=Campylobacter blaseri TaxID=2042961 RepID=A0A2P8QYC2_9BACT|nr:hypothetical protein [Campylobacter blaseri]PSM51244.1 hypothetical protein CQ405_09000 [Campylobacter blaseri]PSM52388.1 hypothetical protein CRN67_09005 [Campylobacter blaseri]QKF86599.1 hypothetical protein CBLAS_1435 [Campylobacter blaseri]